MHEANEESKDLAPSMGRSIEPQHTSLPKHKPINMVDNISNFIGGGTVCSTGTGTGTGQLRSLSAEERAQQEMIGSVMSMAAKTGDTKEQEQARLAELNSKIQETVLKSMHISAA